MTTSPEPARPNRRSLLESAVRIGMVAGPVGAQAFRTFRRFYRQTGLEAAQKLVPLLRVASAGPPETESVKDDIVSLRFRVDLPDASSADVAQALVALEERYLLARAAAVLAEIDDDADLKAWLETPRTGQLSQRDFVDGLRRLTGGLDVDRTESGSLKVWLKERHPKLARRVGGAVLTVVLAFGGGVAKGAGQDFYEEWLGPRVHQVIQEHERQQVQRPDRQPTFSNDLPTAASTSGHLTPSDNV